MLGVTVPQALEAYGEFFVKYVAKQGYTKLLHCLGSNFIEFLRNLNNLHLHLSMSFEAMIPPAFRCDKVLRTSVPACNTTDTVSVWVRCAGEG